MIAVLLTFSLSLFAIVSPTRVLFIGMGLALTTAYLFASNIPLRFFGIEEFIRYSKEPLILAVLARCALSAWDSRVFGRGRPDSAERIEVGRTGRVAFLVLLMWSVVTFAQTGAVGTAGYVRGVVFPAALLLYLNGISDTDMRKLGDAAALVGIILLVFLALVSVVHLYVDPTFLIPDSFRNRLDYEEAYRSVVAYGDIRRYQSFFGDPNRAAIVCILALWFCSIGRMKPLRWIVFALVAALLWLTQSRTGMIVAGLWGIYLFLRPNSSRDIPTVTVIASMIAVVGAVTWLSFSTRASSIEEVSRVILWMGVLGHMVSSVTALILGEGFGWVGQIGGTFAVSEAIQLTSASGRTMPLSVIDNSYLTIVSSMGLLGAMALFVFYRRALMAMAGRLKLRTARRQFWMLVWLMALWSMFFDAFVSFPWTFLFPLVLRYAVAVSSLAEERAILPDAAGSQRIALTPEL